MTQENRCPRCSKPFWQPPGSPRGLCPACLLACGLETNTVGYGDDGQTRANWTPPPVEQLAPLFPELDIIELIGRGGMGAVYKAREKQLDRLVALKILPPEIGADPSFAKRFAREAQAMAKLGHPNIVTIYSFGQREMGTGTGETAPPEPVPVSLYFFIMEYVDGLSLRQLLDRGKISPNEALAIVPQICDALQYAHDRGIVHRDIKPENILLSRSGQVKIADFGLAKLVGLTAAGAAEPAAAGAEAGSPGAPGVTQASEQVMGTPQYMAPEQIDRPGEVDHRADIYSLGVVFYQMLTGELPKGGSGAAFEPPSRKVLIDVRLDEVVLRALEREPARRYQQVSEVKTRVETIVATGPAGAAGAPGLEHPRPPVLPPPVGGGEKRERIAFRWIKIPLLIMGAMLVLLFVGGGMPWREVPFIWLPWSGIMLGVAGASFAAFWGAERARPILRIGAAAGFVCLFLFGAVNVVMFTVTPGSDPLAAAPITVLTVFFFIYAVVLFVLPFSRPPTGSSYGGPQPPQPAAAAIPPVQRGDISWSLVLRVVLHLAALVAALWFFIFVEPGHESVFKDMGVRLPLLTQLVVNARHFAARLGILLVPASLTLLAADAAIMWLLDRAGKRLLAWVWAVTVFLGFGAALAVGFWSLGAPMRQMMQGMQTAPGSEAARPPALAPVPPATQPAAALSPWIETLSNGITVELVGVAEYPSEGKQWWRPDGSPLAEAPYDMGIFGDIYPGKDQVGREFSVRTTRPADWQTNPPEDKWAIKIQPSSKWDGLVTLTRQAGCAAAILPAAVSHATVKYGIAAGPWTTVGDFAGDANTVITAGGFGFDVKHAVEDPNHVSVTVDYRNPNQTEIDVRVVAVDKLGKEIRDSSAITGFVASRNEYASWDETWLFDHLKLKDVAGFRFQTRKYEWAYFPHVSLWPAGGRVAYATAPRQAGWPESAPQSQPVATQPAR